MHTPASRPLTPPPSPAPANGSTPEHAGSGPQLFDAQQYYQHLAGLTLQAQQQTQGMSGGAQPFPTPGGGMNHIPVVPSLSSQPPSPPTVSQVGLPQVGLPPIGVQTGVPQTGGGQAVSPEQLNSGHRSGAPSSPSHTPRHSPSNPSQSVRRNPLSWLFPTVHPQPDAFSARSHDAPQRSRNISNIQYLMTGGCILMALALMADVRQLVPGKSSTEVCQEIVQPDAVLSRTQLAQLLAVSERTAKTAIQQVVSEPYCRLPSISVRAGVTAEREAYPLAFKSDTLFVVLYEGDEYAGFDFSFQR